MCTFLKTFTYNPFKVEVRFKGMNEAALSSHKCVTRHILSNNI